MLISVLFFLFMDPESDDDDDDEINGWMNEWMNEWISSNNEKVMAVPLGAIEVITGRAVRWLAGDVTIVVYWTAADVRNPGPLVGRMGGRVEYWMAGGVRVWLDSSLQAMDTSSWCTQSWRPQPLWGQLPSCVSAPVHSKSSSQICPWPPLYLLSSERPLRLQHYIHKCTVTVLSESATILNEHVLLKGGRLVYA